MPRASLTKLSNKRLNKLAKQGKLKRTSRDKQKLLHIYRDRLHPELKTGQGLDSENVQRTFLGNEKPAEDIPLEEADYEYFATKERDFSFLSETSLHETYEYGYVL